MRLSVVATFLSLCLIGLSAADEAHASTRKKTNIPAEELGSALQTLAKDRNFQIVYVSEEIANVRTQGAVGEFTPEEALKRLLIGTGLTYRYLDDQTVTILSRAMADAGAAGQSQMPTEQPNGASSSKEGKKSASSGFRVAQLDQGADSRSATVENPTSTSRGSNEPVPVEEVVVTGQFEFLSADTSGATNLPLPIEKVPQSISLVSEDFIKAADVKTLGDIAAYTPGALNVGNQEGIESLIKLRGFSSDQAIDGVNLGNGGYSPDWAIVDRLEVVKGPSSVTYGVGSPGGLVNLVTKSDTPNTPSYVSVQGGSWDSWRVEGQVAGAPTSQVRGIGVAVQDQGHNFIDGINHTTTVLYGGFNADPVNSVTAYLDGGWERHERTTFDGIPTEADGSPAPLARSFFIGSSNYDLYTSVYHGEGGVTWHATDVLDLSLKSAVRTTDTHGWESFGSNLQPNGNLALGLDRINADKETFYGVSASAVYRFDSLGLQDSFLSFMSLYQGSHILGDYQGASFNGKGSGKSNIFSGEDAISAVFNSAVLVPGVFTVDDGSRTLTNSVQAVIKFVDHLSALLGASYCKLSEDQNDGGVQTDYDFAGQMSYRGALIYEFLAGTNAYVSYSQSFEPQEFADASGNLLPPVKGDQYEAGVKYRSASERLLLTGAVYQITQKNTAEYYGIVDGSDRYEPVGEVKHKGVELQAIGRITRQWQMNAGYAYLDPKITKDTDLAIVGQTDIFLPKQTADAYTEYTFDTAPVHGLSVGGGVSYVGAQRTSFDGSTKDIAGYFLADLTAGYVIDKWSVRLNVHNLLDRHYFINNYQTLIYGNTVGTPTNLALTIRRNF
jgi:TonB-dependent siderophore receptor